MSPSQYRLRRAERERREAEKAARLNAYTAQVLALCAEKGRTPAITAADRWFLLEPAAAEGEDPADVAAYLYSREVSEQRARMYASSYRSLLAAQKRT